MSKAVILRKWQKKIVNGDPGKATEANAASKILIFDIAELKGVALAQRVRDDNASGTV